MRKARAEERLTALATRAENEAARAAAAHEAEQAVLEAKRQIRKSRKTSEKVDANLRRQSRRDALTAYGKPSTT